MWFDIARPRLRAASILFSAVLLVPIAQEKGCEQKGIDTTPGGAPGGEFDRAAVERQVQQKLEDLRLAFESKQVRAVVKEIDPTGLEDYPTFEDQISYLFDSTGELRLFFRSANVQVQPAGGVGKPARAQAQVDAEMAYSRKEDSAQKLSKTARLAFDLVYGDLGWRFVRIEPRTFFTP